MGEPILAAGQCTADGSVMTRVAREGYRVQSPDGRWTLGGIRDAIVNFFRREEREPGGRVMGTDMVYVLPSGTEAVSMSTIEGTGERVYCGLQAPPLPSADDETIVVWGHRREEETPDWEEQVDRAERWSQDYVMRDMGPDPARPYDFRFNQCVGANIENDGFTLRLPTGGAIAGLSCETVAPPQVGFEFDMGGIVRNLRDQNEERVRRRTQGIDD